MLAATRTTEDVNEDVNVNKYLKASKFSVFIIIEFSSHSSLLMYSTQQNSIPLIPYPGRQISSIGA